MATLLKLTPTILILATILCYAEGVSTRTNSTQNSTNSTTATSTLSTSSTTSVPTVNDTIVVTVPSTTDHPFMKKFKRIFENPGSRVGPFYLFRSSLKNAEKVNEAFRHRPILRSFGLALGDEFPKMRDELISQHSIDANGRKPEQFATTFQKTLAALTNTENWKYDSDNDNLENQEPFMRPTRYFVNSLFRNFGGIFNRSRSTAATPTFKLRTDELPKPVKSV